jgi:hypothetical protein
MPIFARRRLQHMLDKISSLSEEKSRDLLARLENKRVEQALPAEMELALLWALSALGELDIEPIWWADSRRPEAYTEALIPGRAAVIEVAAPNDNDISGEAAMDHVARAIADHASRIRPKIGAFLYFRFREERGYVDGAYFRQRLAPQSYKLTEQAATAICRWIESGEVDRVRLRIKEPGLDVEVEKMARKQTRYYNVWSSMPPETYSLMDNHLYRLLLSKRDQIKGARPGILRIIFLADAGSTLIKELGKFGEIDATGRRVSGREIILHFLSNYNDVDAVVAFSPHRRASLRLRDELSWSVAVSKRPGVEIDETAFIRLASMLPKPRFEGEQARSLHRQGAFSPNARGWHMPMQVSWMKTETKVRVSARALLDLLAGRMTAEQFRYQLGERRGERNMFQHWLDKGMTLSAVNIESGGTDEDDDYLVLTLNDDPAAGALRLQGGAKDTGV